MTRVAALLDVDHTLLFDNELNHSLLDSLLDRGIKDIYLFTDMVFSSSSMRERQNLIRGLTAKGFIVHGVITPADLAWMIPDEEAINIPQTWPKKFEGEAFINHLKEKYPTTFEIINNGYRPGISSPGLAYAQTYRQYLRMLRIMSRKQEAGDLPLISSDITFKSYSAKIVASQFLNSCGAGYTHVKGLMLDCFLNQLPSWVEEILIADDNNDVNDTIVNFKPVYDDVWVPPITMLHVKGLSSPKWCDEKLSHFFKLSHTPRERRSSSLPLLSIHRFATTEIQSELSTNETTTISLL